jgi:hypothetical protein
MNIEKIIFKHFPEMLILSDAKLEQLFSGNDERTILFWELDSAPCFKRSGGIKYVWNHPYGYTPQRTFRATKEAIYMSYTRAIFIDKLHTEKITYKFKPGEDIESVIKRASFNYYRKLKFDDEDYGHIISALMKSAGVRRAYYKRMPTLSHLTTSLRLYTGGQITYFAETIVPPETEYRWEAGYQIIEITREEFMNEVAEW